MPEPYIKNRPPTTEEYRKALGRLWTACLVSLLLLSIWLTPSYATVIATSSDTVQMTGQDLRTLLTEITAYKAEAEATQEALNNERGLFAQYEASVNLLIEKQEAERQAAMDAIKQLKRKLDAPALELYAGYGSEVEWEGGIRLVWRLN